MQHYFPEGFTLHRGRSNMAYTPEQLEKAELGHQILEGIVTMCDENKNLMVDLGAANGIIPYQQAALGLAEGTVKDVAILSRVGRPVCFCVTNAAARPVQLSRRAAQQQALDDYLLSLHSGDVLPAIVTNPVRFGAFCDIGCGLIGLIGIENISISRISHSRERFTEGQQIYVAVRSIDTETGRFTLTHKELLGTWEENAADFQVGQTVTGIVRSKKDYGLFVELSPNLSGLAEVREELQPGDTVSVYIKSILPEKHKIKLVALKKLDASLLPRRPLHYFTTEGHLDSWQYGRPGSGEHLTIF